jgi:hypothetical protein
MQRAERVRGAALLEALAALAILSITAVAVLSLAGESIVLLDRVQRTEREMVRASALLDAVALWPAVVLDQHLGDRPQGDWRLRIEKQGPLYHIVLADTATSRLLLRTAVHRRSPGAAARAP